MNFNSFTGLVGGTKRNQIPLQTLAATTETAFVVNTDSGTPTTAFLAIPRGNGIAGSGNPLNPDTNAALLQQNPSGLVIPRGISRPEFNSTSFDGRPFRIRLYGVGTAVAAGSNNPTITLYQGTSTTLGSDQSLVAQAFTVATGGSFNFLIQATMLWDSTSQLLAGFVESNLGFGSGTYTANAKTTVRTVTSLANMSFLASTTWGAANGGTIQLNEFSIERV